MLRIKFIKFDIDVRFKQRDQFRLPVVSAGGMDADNIWPSWGMLNCEWNVHADILSGIDVPLGVADDHHQWADILLGS